MLFDKRGGAILVVVALALLGVLADLALKQASLAPRPFASRWFALGTAAYAATAFGWVFSLRQLKLSEIGHLYCIATMLLLTAGGVLFFHESLRPREIIGLVLGIASLALLRRFG